MEPGTRGYGYKTYRTVPYRKIKPFFNDFWKVWYQDAIFIATGSDPGES